MPVDLSLGYFQEVCSELIPVLESFECEEEAATARRDEVLTAVRLILKRRLRKGVFSPNLQSESLNTLRNCVDPKTLRQPAVRRVCWEYWRLLRNGMVNPENLAAALRCYVTTGFAQSSTDAEDFPLHRAVFEGRLYCIRNLCLHESDAHIFTEIDSADPLGHSALMLAVKLHKLEEALVLVDHGANPKYRSSSDQPTPLEQSAGMKDKALSRVLLSACQRQHLAKWETMKSKLAAAIRQLPDFELKMKWECKSKFLPFVKRWTPSDAYQIYKQGDDLRCDMTLVGWNKFRAERGHISLLFKGSEGRVFLIDRESSGVRELLQSPNEKLIDVQLNQMLRYQRASREIRSATLDLVPVTDWRGDPLVKRIGVWNCQQYKARCNMDVSMSKRAITIDQRISEMKDFDEYFAYCTQPQMRSRAASSTSSVVTVSPRSSRNVSKSLVAHLWLSEEFPLQMPHFLPLLSFLGSVSKKAKTLKTMLARFSSLRSGFPVKARVPLLMTLKAHVLFEQLRIGPVGTELFSVPDLQEKATPQQAEDLLSINEFPEVNEDDIFQESMLGSSSRSTTKREMEGSGEEEKEEFLQSARDRWARLDVSVEEEATGEENLDETAEMLPNLPRDTWSAPVTARTVQIKREVPALTKQQVLTTLRLTSRSSRSTKDVDILLL